MNEVKIAIELLEENIRRTNEIIKILKKEK